MTGLTAKKMINETLICSTFQKIHQVNAVYILGSAVNDKLRFDSDIDIAVLPAGGNHLALNLFSDIIAELSLQLGYPIDLGMISSANLIYAREAILKGKRIFTRNQEQVELAEATLLGLYARFNEERQEVLRAYSA